MALGPTCTRLWRALLKKKAFDADLQQGHLNRCLSRWDVTALGVGSALGVGVYVLTGLVVPHVAGPAVLLSFLIAALAALFAGLCYAELGSRVPGAGSAYEYTYVCMGELAAFLIGWTLVLEGVFGTAAVARAFGMYLDWLTERQLSAWLEAVMPLNSQHLAQYFDLVAFFLVLVLGAMLVCGVRASMWCNNAMGAVNVVVILIIIIGGAFYADTANWSIPGSEVPAETPGQFGTGGFFPYGAWGVLRGAAICFYGFVGFNAINTAGEEVKEPRRAIPCAILLSLAVVLVCYTGVATVLTMMLPYYQEVSGVSVAAAFSAVGATWAHWLVGIGAIFGICTSMFGAMFPLPRVVYAMASDGLLFRWLAHVPRCTRSPLPATLLPTLLIAVLTGILELELLVLMMCIGTLLSYTIVAICVLLLRYDSQLEPVKVESSLRRILGYGERQPTSTSYAIFIIYLALFVVVCLTLALVGCLVVEALIPAIVLNAIALLIILAMTLQPRANPDIVFKTPLVPLVPCLCIYVNINLMILIDVRAWIAVGIWMLIGIPIYIICACMYRKEKKSSHLQGNLNEAFTHEYANENGKPHIQITVESPTPPESIRLSGGSRIADEVAQNTSHTLDEHNEAKILESDIEYADETKVEHEEITKAAADASCEKEAIIIDLLDQVLQAEEDSFGEISSLTGQDDEKEIIISATQDPIPHRKSLTDLSDAGSDISLGGTMHHDVVAQVHREDLPIVEELTEDRQRDINDDEIDDEQVTYFNLSERNSPTDESGYSDSTENIQGSIESIEERPRIPTPPPFNELLFAAPTFRSFAIAARPVAPRPEPEVVRPRESIQSSGSLDDATIVFGSARQMNFMSKLSVIYNNKINENEGLKSRSQSTENLSDIVPVTVIPERPAYLDDLKKGFQEREPTQLLKPVNKEEPKSIHVSENEDSDEETSTYSRDNLKSKLEVILAIGGPVLIKPRLVKSKSTEPEEPASDNSSVESVPSKLSKTDKNDTLKLQKAKFGAVLNSIRLSFNDDVV